MPLATKNASETDNQERGRGRKTQSLMKSELTPVQETDKASQEKQRENRKSDLQIIRRDNLTARQATKVRAPACRDARAPDRQKLRNPLPRLGGLAWADTPVRNRICKLGGGHLSFKCAKMADSQAGYHCWLRWKVARQSVIHAPSETHQPSCLTLENRLLCRPT